MTTKEDYRSLANDIVSAVHELQRIGDEVEMFSDEHSEPIRILLTQAQIHLDRAEMIARTEYRRLRDI